MKLESVSIVRLAPGDRAARVVDALKQSNGLDTVRVLKAEGKAWVRLVEVAGERVVVKCRPLHTLHRRLQSLYTLGHAHRQWRNAYRLKRARITTAEPIVIARATIDAVRCELLALAYIEGPTLLEVLNDIKHRRGPSVHKQHEIARAVGSSVAAMLKANLCNRDHKPSNLIVSQRPDAALDIAVIDCVGIERYSVLGVDHGEGVDMLASLMIEPIGCDCPPRCALWMRALRAAEAGASKTKVDRHANLRAIIQDVQWGINQHPDPRPKTNPLSTPPS